MQLPVPAALRNIGRKPFRPQKPKKLRKAVLTAEIASSLLPKKKPRQDLAADKFTDIEEAAAVILAAHQGSLSLNGLTHLSEEGAETLSKHGNSLYLNGLTSLSEASARSLAKHHDKLFLNGIEHISDEVALALSAHKGDLLLNGIQKLSDESSMRVSKHMGWLHLDGLTEFPVTPGHIALAHTLAARHHGTLALNEAKELPLPILKILVTHRGKLELNGLESLSPESAAELAGFSDWLEINGLKKISRKAAKIIAARKRHWGLYEMEGLNEKVFTQIYEAGLNIKEDTDDLEEESSGGLFGKRCSTASDQPSSRPDKNTGLNDSAKSIQNQEGGKKSTSGKSTKSVRPPEKTVEESNDDSWVAEENEALNRVAGITEQEREMYRELMGWGREGALSFAKIGKRYSMTASAARSICERVEKRMFASKKFPLETFHQNPPAPDESRPRDGKTLRKTDDLLFLALMLESCAKTGWIEASRSTSKHVVYRVIPQPKEPVLKGQEFWKTKTLKNLIFEHAYWEVRRLCQCPDGHRIKIPRGHVLKFPVKRGSDPLLSSEKWSEQFHSWAGVNDLVVKPGEILCPLCGPMPPLTVSVSSPQITWEMDCGRAYDFYCCSGCLGTLDNRLTRMN